MQPRSLNLHLNLSRSRNFKSAQKEKITNIQNEHKKHSEKLQNKLNFSVNKIQQLEKIIEEKSKAKETNIDHESGKFKLIDNKNGNF
jgi:exopolysaccharide biosynthesis protein